MPTRLLVTWSLALLAGVGVGVSACEANKDLGSFSCGDEECDVRTEVCNYDPQCSGGDTDDMANPPQCGDIPAECNGRAGSQCLNTGGRSCSEREGGGFDCSFACG